MASISQDKDIRNSFGKALKLATPISAVFGTISDISSPLGPISFYLLLISLTGLVISLFLSIKFLRNKKISELFSAKSTVFFLFFLISTFFLSIVYFLNKQSPEDGFLANNVEFVSDYQQKIFSKLSDIDIKQTKILKSQERTEEGMVEIKNLLIFELSDLKEALIKNADANFINTPKTASDFLFNAMKYKNGGDYFNSIKNFESYFKLNDNYLEPYFEYLEILELPTFSVMKDNFKQSIIASKYPIDNVMKTLLIEDINNRIEKFQDLTKNEANLLYTYFLNKDKLKLNTEKLNQGAKLSCKDIEEFNSMSNTFSSMINNDSLSQYFIDKVTLNEDLKSLEKKTKDWSNIIKPFYINLSKSLNNNEIIGILINQFDCNEKELLKIINRLENEENKSVGKTTLLKGKGKIKLENGFYYLQNDKSLDKNQYVEIFNNALRWVAKDIGVNLESGFEIRGNKIIANSEYMKINFEITSSSELKYIFNNTEWIYIREKENQ